MKVRHKFLICRAAVFAMLFATAGATSLSVASSAQDARQGKFASSVKTLDLAQGTQSARVAKSSDF